MVTEIQALPTTYHGVRFRSRTEARWAAFFDYLNITWQYEPEGFALPASSKHSEARKVYYLPDFWLPGLRMWIEVKPERDLAEDEIHKIAAFAHTGSPEPNIDPPGLPWGGIQFVVLCGAPDGRSIWEHHTNPSWPGHTQWVPYWDENFEWVACYACQKVGMQWHGYAGRLCPEHIPIEDSRGDIARIQRAVEFAQSQRFGIRGA